MCELCLTLLKTLQVHGNRHEPGHEKMCLMPYANNKGADQTAQRLCCSLPRQNDTSSLYIRNFKILAGLCRWAGQFVSCLVGDSRRHIFSRRGSHICFNWSQEYISLFNSLPSSSLMKNQTLKSLWALPTGLIQSIKWNKRDLPWESEVDSFERSHTHPSLPCC